MRGRLYGFLVFVDAILVTGNGLLATFGLPTCGATGACTTGVVIVFGVYRGGLGQTICIALEYIGFFGCYVGWELRVLALGVEQVEDVTIAT